MAYLIEELGQMGHEQVVFVREKSAFEAWCKSQSITYLPHAFGSQYSLMAALALKEFAVNEQVDVVHIHSAKGHGLAVFAHLLGMHVPLVLSRRVDFPVKQNWLSKFKYNYAGIHKIICVSDEVRRLVQKAIKDREKAVTIYDGIDTKRLITQNPNLDFLKEKYNLPADVAIIGNTAALAPHKDYFTFLNTAKELINRGRFNYRFFIVGKGALEQQLKQYTNNLGISEYVIFTGFVTNLHEVLPCFNLFLMTSETEGLGTSLLDAMALNIPIVATKAGGIPEIVLHEKTGLLAPVKDANALANAVERLLSNSSLRSEITTQAKNQLENFSKTKMTQSTLRVYQEAVPKK